MALHHGLFRRDERKSRVPRRRKRENAGVFVDVFDIKPQKNGVFVSARCCCAVRFENIPCRFVHCAVKGGGAASQGQRIPRGARRAHPIIYNVKNSPDLRGLSSVSCGFFHRFRAGFGKTASFALKTCKNSRAHKMRPAGKRSGLPWEADFWDVSVCPGAGTAEKARGKVRSRQGRTPP